MVQQRLQLDSCTIKNLYMLHSGKLYHGQLRLIGIHVIILTPSFLNISDLQVLILVLNLPSFSLILWYISCPLQ